MAGPPPLNGTCRRLTPAVSLNSSPPRCWKLPMPAEAYCSWPGFSLAAASRSFTECTGKSGLTTRTFGPDARMANGVNDLIGAEGDRGECLDRVVGQLVEPGIDRVRERDDQGGIAVAWGVRGPLRSDPAAGARPAVVHHHLLAEPFAQMSGDQPPDHVVAAAGW